MLKSASALLVAGFCIAGAAFAQSSVDRVDHAVTTRVDSYRGDTSDEHWRSGDGLGEHDENIGRSTAVENSAAVGVSGDTTVVRGPQVAGDSARVETRTQVQSDTDVVAASDAQAPRSSDRADRTGPVPFADIGHVGGSDTQLSTDAAVEQDKQLLVRGEISGDDLVINLPAGTKHDTLSLRSDKGLNLSRADVQRLGRFDGDTLRIRRADLGEGDLGNLWVWGTGPDSASLLQRVAMSGDTSSTVARADDIESRDVPQRRSAGIGTTLGAPINEPNMMSDDAREEVEARDDGQIEKENRMLEDAGMSSKEIHKTW